MVGILTGSNVLDDANGAHGTKETGVNRATLTGSRDVATQITGNNIAIHAGQDLSTQGTQVIAEVGGNLNIESLQDTSYYKSQQQSMSGSISVGAGKVSGSLNMASSKVDGNYQSVTEQSGINAGDGGFQIKVNGNTDLKGGKIAATDKAVEQNKNSFTTNTLTTSDIENRSQYSAESICVSAGGGWIGSGTGNPGGQYHRAAQHCVGGQAARQLRLRKSDGNACPICRYAMSI